MLFLVVTVFPVVSCIRASQVVLVVKNLSANAGDIRDTGLTPVSERFPGGHIGATTVAPLVTNYWSFKLLLQLSPS